MTGKSEIKSVVWPPKSPEGLAFTPAYALPAGAQLVFLSAITPDRSGRVERSIMAQTKACFDNLQDALDQIGDGARALKMTVRMTDVREVWSHVEARQAASLAAGDDRFDTVSTLLQVPACTHEDARLELDVWAVAEPALELNVSTVLDGPSDVPLGVAVDGKALLHVIHASPTDDAGRGAHIELGACLDQVEKQLAAVDGTLRSVVKLTVYLADMRAWPACRALISERFGHRCPAMTALAVGCAGIPGASVDLDAWAATPRDRTRPSEESSLVSIDMSGRILAISGSAAIPVYIGGKAEDMYNYQPEAEIGTQTRVSMNNYAAILDAAGASWDDIFKTTWYVTDRREWKRIESIALEYFKRPLPGCTVVEVPKFVLAGVRIEPDMWATLPAGVG